MHDISSHAYCKVTNMAMQAADHLYSLPATAGRVDTALPTDAKLLPMAEPVVLLTQQLQQSTLTEELSFVLLRCPAVAAAAEVRCLIHVQPQPIEGGLVIKVLQLVLEPLGGVGGCKVVGVDSLARPHLRQKVSVL